MIICGVQDQREIQPHAFTSLLPRGIHLSYSIFIIVL